MIIQIISVYEGGGGKCQIVSFVICISFAFVYNYLQVHLNGLLQKDFSETVKTVLSTVPDLPQNVLTDNT